MCEAMLYALPAMQPYHAPMPATTTSPLTRDRAMDLYFMEHRAKLIDLAAFLDRLDRSAPATASPSPTPDFRLEAFKRALAVVSDGRPDRARRILELFSDPTNEPIAKAPMKGALGAYQKS
jgi:hypothetical protein